MKTITNKKFQNESVELDGNDYQNCQFISCKMIYSAKEPVGLANCVMQDCQWQLAGAADLTLDFLAQLYQGGGQQLIEGTFENIRSGGILKSGNQQSRLH